MKNLYYIRQYILLFFLCTLTISLFGQASYTNNGITGEQQGIITVPPGHNRLLVVHAGSFGNGRSATFNEQPMTEVVSQNEGEWIARTTIWVLPLGSGCEISGPVSIFNNGGGPAKRFWAGSFQHVNQTTPVSDQGSAAIPSGTALTTLSGLTNVANMDIILDGLIVGNNGCDPPMPSALEGGTVLYNETVSSNCLLTAARFKIGPGDDASVSWAVAQGWSKPHVAIVISGITANNNPPVTDTDPPVANCQNVTVNLDANGNGSTTANAVNNGSTDNCSIASRTLSQTEFNCSYIGSNTVTLTIVDGVNLSSTCMATVTVENNSAPKAICRYTTVQLDANGNVTISAPDVDNGSTGACSTPSLSLSETSFDCNDLGRNIVTLTLTDVDNGLTARCGALVTVEDNVAPTAICQDVTVQLNANGIGTLSPETANNGSNDACGVNNLSLNTTSFNCSDMGNNISVVLTATDNNDNSSTCSATVAVEDNVVPTALCQSVTVQLDANGNATISAANVDAGSNDACGIASTVVNSNNFNCSQSESSITLIVTDNNSNSSSCTATITAEDNIPPSAVCKNATIQLDENGVAIPTFSEVDNGSADNCGVTSSIITPSSFDCNDVGDNNVVLLVKDGDLNSSNCLAIITVEDNIVPQPVCLNPTITFNGTADIALQIDQVWDDVHSMDNCDMVSFVSMTPDKVFCEQLGSIIPVLITVEDANGNPAECTANVTIDGLPCGWSSNPDGINCPDGSSADFDPNTGTFSLTSEGCYDAGGYYSNVDAHSFIGTDLCGNGEMIAELTQVNGSGWAGISMREGTGPSDRMLQLSIDGVFLTKREMRTIPGGLAFNHLFQTQSKNWLRLARSGNTFGAYHSTNGINWAPIMITNIAMPNCIQVGLFTENAAPTGNLTGMFENVSIKTEGTSLALSVPTTNQADELFNEYQPEVAVYPNPSAGEVMINLQAYMGHETNIRLFNSNGQLLESMTIEEVQASRLELTMDPYQDGLYLIQIQVEGFKTLTKKLTLMR